MTIHSQLTESDGSSHGARVAVVKGAGVLVCSEGALLELFGL